MATRQITDINAVSILGMTGDNFTIRIVLTILQPWVSPRFYFSMDNGAGQSIRVRESSDGTINFARTTTAGANGSATVVMGSIPVGTTLDIEFEQSTVNGLVIRINGQTGTDTGTAAKQAWSGVLPSVHLGCQNPTGTASGSANSTIASFQFWSLVVPLLYIP